MRVDELRPAANSRQLVDPRVGGPPAVQPLDLVVVDRLMFRATSDGDPGWRATIGCQTGGIAARSSSLSELQFAAVEMLEIVARAGGPRLSPRRRSRQGVV